MFRSLVVLSLMALLALPAEAEIEQELTLGASWAVGTEAVNAGYLTRIVADDYKGKLVLKYNQSESDGKKQMDELKALARMDRKFGWGFSFAEVGYRHEDVKNVQYSRISVGVGRPLPEITEGLEGEVGLTTQVNGGREEACKLGLRYGREFRFALLKGGLNTYIGLDDYDWNTQAEREISKNLWIVVAQRYEKTENRGQHIGSIALKWVF